MTPRRCPYFAEIVERQHHNPQQSWRLFAAGDARARWRQARLWMRPGWPGASLLLPDTDPLSIRWPAGSAIVDVTNQAADLVRCLAQALARDGVTHALLADLQTPARSFHLRAPSRLAA